MIRVAQSRSAIDFGCFSGVLHGDGGGGAPGGIHSVIHPVYNVVPFHELSRYNDVRLCMYQTMLLQTKIHIHSFGLTHTKL